MYGGLFICIACLGKEWREAIDYALDVSNMSILVMFVVFVVIGIFVISYIVIFSKTVFKRIIACYNRKKGKHNVLVIPLKAFTYNVKKHLRGFSFERLY